MTGTLLDEFVAFLQVVFIDLVLAGDNVIVVGLAVAGLPQAARRKAIWIGMGGAVGLRILFSLMALRLLAIIGLTLAGGLLLVWVAWKLYRELAASRAAAAAKEAPAGPPRSLRSAALNILAADLSMSLDNALAVAGAARNHVEILIAGLVLSVALVAVAAERIARTIARRPWLGYIGLAVVSYVAVDMIVRGAHEVLHSL